MHRLYGLSRIKQLEVLEAMFAVEDDVMLRHAKSPLTAKIQELDAERDKLYRMVRAICKAMMEMMDADRKQAATEVYDIIKAYGWIPTYKYDRQTGMLENLCQDLQGSHAQMVELLGLIGAVADLKKANDDFAAFVAERSENRGEFVRGEMAAARQDTEQAYYALIEVVNSLSTLFVAGGGAAAENPYADFINYTNQEINRLKISELKQKTRSDEAEPLLGHQFGWENPADGTDPDDPTVPGEETPPTTTPEINPAEKIKLVFRGIDNKILHEVVVPVDYQMTEEEYPTPPEGTHWNFTLADLNLAIGMKNPGDTITVRAQA